MASMALNYESLDVDTYEIRLLTILPVSPDSLNPVVRCTMETTNLINPIQYDALSYCWGDPTATTKIFVNDTEIDVTINLADALYHLRKLGIGKVWADALCINQNDKQEKGLQIRNMKHIYSRAHTTYSWIGMRGAYNTKGVIAIIKSLMDSNDSISLTLHSHTCNSTDAQLSLAHARQLWERGCRSCETVYFFEGLQHILGHQYWRRRWIIQEISVSSRHIILCDDTLIPLHELERAVARCQQSSYWDLNTTPTHTWFDQVVDFRRAYQEYSHQKESELSLCQAIERSQNFESTDPRDAIFSLLDLCHDGPDLVPTPNYSQPMEVIVTGLTRALIQRHKHLDFICINSMSGTSSKALPSWTSDWLGASMVSHAYDLASGITESRGTLFCMGSSINRNALLGAGTILRVQCYNIGTIVIMTSSTNLADASPVLSLNLFPNPYSTSNPPYHYTSSEVLTALLSCFTVSSKGRHKRFSALGSAALHWDFFSYRFLPTFQPRNVLFEGSVACTGSTLHQWLKANASVQICGRSLKAWTRRGPTSTISIILLRVGLLRSRSLLRLEKVNKLLQRVQLTLHQLYIGFLIIILVIASYYLSALVIGPALFVMLFESSSLLSKKILQSFDNRIPVSKPGKRLILTDKGFIGMADDRAKRGDVLCHLLGCSEPVVLRRVKKYGEGATERKTYAVIGECYIHFPKECLYEYLGPTDRSAADYEDRKQEWIRNTQVEEIDLI